MKNHFLDQAKQIIFGMQDGLVSTIVLSTTVAGITHNNYYIIIAAIAEGLGGGISMATGVYLGSKSQKEILEAKIKGDEDMRGEAIKKLKTDGIEKNDAVEIINLLYKYPISKAKLIPNIVLGQDINSTLNPYMESLFMGGSFILGSIVPIIAYFFLKGAGAVILSVILTALTLFFVGVMKGNFAKLSKIKSGLEIMIIGMLAGLLGYILGIVL
ncbi:MAG: VIT1/CCC1 transporter family protein [Patescibacteria group bacterium]